MRASVRRVVGVLSALVLTCAGLIVGAVPATAGVGIISGSNGDIQVTAQVQVPDQAPYMAVWLEHNGISAELTSAMIRVTNPSNEEIYARETAFERPGTRWEAT
ncbi:MAG TPA: hypothetical protein VIQ11_04120, partial [Mycobacterium sp.]